MTYHLPREASPLIPDDGAPVLPAQRPTWWTVRTVRAIGFVCVGLAVALSLISTLVSWRSAEAANARAVTVEQRLATLEEYVQGRGEYRDREAERIEQQAQERIRAGLCDLLDQLPPSDLLDVPRQKYGCGPGVQEPEPEPPPAVEPSSASGATSRPEPSSAPSSSAPRRQAPQQPEAPTVQADDPAPAAQTTTPPRLPDPAPSPQPTPTTPPRLLDPITDPVCDALGICL